MTFSRVSLAFPYSVATLPISLSLSPSLLPSHSPCVSVLCPICWRAGIVLTYRSYEEGRRLCVIPACVPLSPLTLTLSSVISLLYNLLSSFAWRLDCLFQRHVFPGRFRVSQNHCYRPLALQTFMCFRSCGSKSTTNSGVCASSLCLKSGSASRPQIRPILQAVFVGLFVLQQNLYFLLYYSFQPCMFLKNATGLSWKEMERKISRIYWLSLFCLLLSTPLSKFPLEPAEFYDWLPWAYLSLVQPLSWEEGMSCLSVWLLSCSLSLTGWIRLCEKEREKGIESANVCSVEWVGLSKARWCQDWEVSL